MAAIATPMPVARSAMPSDEMDPATTMGSSAPTESVGGSNWRDCQNAGQDQAGDFQRSQF
jgi:hypothetical protein